MNVQRLNNGVFLFTALMNLLVLPFVSAATISNDEFATTQMQPNTKIKYDLVVSAVFQNENFFLKEWVEYYKLLGVQHFYLYNNSSTDNYLEILQPYIDAGIVDLFEWSGETQTSAEYTRGFQLPAYYHTLSIAKDTARWVAFIDLDEFIVPHKHNNLVDLLKNYEQYAGLVINWQMFGTSWIDSLNDNELIIEKLILKDNPNTAPCHLVKSIVQPKYVGYFPDHPHSVSFQSGYFAVDANGTHHPDGCPTTQSVLLDVVQINHYYFGTRDWFINNKLKRRIKWGIPTPQEIIDPLIACHNIIKDECACRFVPKLKKQMFKPVPH
jgi:Glycosyltransferase family 92